MAGATVTGRERKRETSSATSPAAHRQRPACPPRQPPTLRAAPSNGQTVAIDRHGLPGVETECRPLGVDHHRPLGHGDTGLSAHSHVEHRAQVDQGQRPGLDREGVLCVMPYLEQRLAARQHRPAGFGPVQFDPAQPRQGDAAPSDSGTRRVSPAAVSTA